VIVGLSTRRSTHTPKFDFTSAKGIDNSRARDEISMPHPVTRPVCRRHYFALFGTEPHMIEATREHRERSAPPETALHHNRTPGACDRRSTKCQDPAELNSILSRYITRPAPGCSLTEARRASWGGFSTRLIAGWPENSLHFWSDSLRRVIGSQVQNLELFLFLVQNNLGLSGLRWECLGRCIPQVFAHRRLQKREDRPNRTYPSARFACV